MRSVHVNLYQYSTIYQFCGVSVSTEILYRNYYFNIIVRREEIQHITRNMNTMVRYFSQDIKFGGTPLHWSCSKEVICDLVVNNCDLNAVNFNGHTALHIMVNIISILKPAALECDMECLRFVVTFFTI